MPMREPSTSSRVSQPVDGRAGPGLGVDPGGEALQPQRLAGAGLVEHQAGDAAGGQLLPVAGGVHVLLGRVQAVDQHDHRRGAVVGGRRLAEVGRQRRPLVGDRHPADPRVLEVERLLRQLQHPLVGGHPVRVGLREHPLGLAQVVGGAEVQLAGGAGVPGLLRLLGLPDELVGQRRPGAQEVRRAGVLALGGGVLDRAAGAVDLVDQAAAVERRDDAQVPDVVAREVLEHGWTLFLARLNRDHVHGWELRA